MHLVRRVQGARLTAEIAERIGAVCRQTEMCGELCGVLLLVMRVLMLLLLVLLVSGMRRNVKDVVGCMGILVRWRALCGPRRRGDETGELVSKIHVLRMILWVLAECVGKGVSAVGVVGTVGVLRRWRWARGRVSMKTLLSDLWFVAGGCKVRHRRIEEGEGGMRRRRGDWGALMRKMKKSDMGLSAVSGVQLVILPGTMGPCQPFPTLPAFIPSGRNQCPIKPSSPDIAVGRPVWQFRHEQYHLCSAKTLSPNGIPYVQLIIEWHLLCTF